MKLKRWARWLAPVVVIVVLLIAFRDELPFLGEAWTLLAAAPPLPLVCAICTALLALFAMSGVIQILLNVGSAEGGVARVANVRNTNAIVFASNAWSTTVPGGPALSAWLTYRVHRSWGATPGLCGWFFVISGALSTVWMVIIGFTAVMFMGAALSLTTLALTLLISTSVMAAVFWATRNPDVIKPWLGFLPARVRRRVEEPAAKVVDQIAAIRVTRSQFALAALLSLLNQLLDVATMVFAVQAVGGEIPLNGIALAYIMTKLAGAAQVTPGGFGTVEPVAVGMLVAGGLPLVQATAATVVYRAISFVFITAIGWVVYLAVYAGRGFMLGRGAGEGATGEGAPGSSTAASS